MSSIDSLRGRPGLVGCALAVFVLVIDQLLGRVSVYDTGVLLFVAGVLAVVWGDGGTRLAGVASGVAGVGVLVGAKFLTETGWGVLPLLLAVLVVGFVGWLQWVSANPGRETSG